MLWQIDITLRTIPQEILEVGSLEKNILTVSDWRVEDVILWNLGFRPQTPEEEVLEELENLLAEGED